MKNKFELPEESLASLDKDGYRVYLYPKEVIGFYKSLKNKIHAVLIVLFLVLPWIKINHNPVILLDIAHRKFSIMGQLFFAHHAPILVLLFLSLIVTVAFITAVYGRVWCGWACPQTVYIEGVFRRIESFFEGDSHTRRVNDAKGMTAQLFFQKAGKWFFFVLFTLLITHSFLAYFVGTDRVFEMIKLSPSQNMESFLVVLVLSSILLFDFGWFREQFCVIMCPYGRLQSLLIDRSSKVVIYDHNRGEPRKSDQLLDAGQKAGDCVNCYKCVQVCPTGVDIRRGTQLECIGCTACIDACNEVMTKINKPKGLIRYDSENSLLGKKSNFFRPRTLVYLTLILALYSGLAIALQRHTMMDIQVLRAKETPYQQVREGNKIWIINHIKLELSNQSVNTINVEILNARSGSEVFEVVSANKKMELLPGQQVIKDFFVKFPKEALQDGNVQSHIEIAVQEQEKPLAKIKKELSLVGPFF